MLVIYKLIDKLVYKWHECKNHSSIKFFPFIVFHDVEYYLIPNVKILRDSGVSESNFVKSIYYFPRLFHGDAKNFEKNVAVVKETGMDPLSSQFISAIKAKVGMSKSLWERKLGTFCRGGVGLRKSVSQHLQRILGLWSYPLIRLWQQWTFL